MAAKKTVTKSPAPLAPFTNLEERIHFMRGQKVMLDDDLAALYGVTTKRLNEQVRRNRERFPEDFMFQLTAEEAESLRSQIATLKKGRGQHRKYLPFAFTEHGAVMLASVLSSPIAIEASIQVVRAFVRLRSILAAHKELAKRLEALEKKTKQNFDVVFKLLAQVIAEAEAPKKRIGFRLPDER
ncbi:MAG: ORF6N domain-containing protein [Acidobacteria bacterium]|nr:ORF6N domain-containing protein [Acidobacteriota bacterium]